MRHAKRWRYYCDHCGKAGGSKWHMANHERGCTANPDRVCGMHRAAVDLVQPDMKAIIAHVKSNWPEWDFQYTPAAFEQMQATNAWLQEQVQGCPACLLHVYRMLQISTVPDKIAASTWNGVYFNYKEFKELWWANHPHHDNDNGYC
jgi:hypothetical protein